MDIKPSDYIPKPPWLRMQLPKGAEYAKLKSALNVNSLHTVCQEALCPNLGECWSKGTATLMILGDTCTRGCRFCNVKSGNPKGVVDLEEPIRVARQISQSNLKYVVITCVDRDDLPDGGAEMFAKVIREVRHLNPSIHIEALVGDYRGRTGDIDLLLAGAPDVYAHNLETVRRLTPSIRDVRASYEQSLAVLKYVHQVKPELLLKSSLMAGMGESLEELIETASDLKSAGVQIITFGQYLRPSAKHLPVSRYVHPDEFIQLENEARKLGFLFVASGVFVRSSYRAAELFTLGHLKSKTDVT